MLDGEEGVAASIPAEGLKNPLETGGFLCGRGDSNSAATRCMGRTWAAHAK
jgi:hypothetical protein